MNVYTSNDFTGMWPVGASAVVVADTIEEAFHLLHKELEHHGLKFDGTLRLLATDQPHVVVLQDGNY